MIGDGVIIRYRRGNKPWTYEVCTEDDLWNYENTRDEYQRCSQEIIDWISGYEMEVITHKVSLSKKFLERFE